MLFRKVSWLFYIGGVALIVAGAMAYLATVFIYLGAFVLLACIGIEVFLKMRSSSTTDVLNKLSRQRDRGEITQAQFESERQKYFAQKPR